MILAKDPNSNILNDAMGKITQNRKNSWISNASNSFVYATKDALGELFPNIKQAAESTKEIVKAGKFDKGDENIVKQYSNKAKKSVKQAFEDLKAGRIYNGDRAEKEMMKGMVGDDMLSDFDDMSFDDFDDDSSSGSDSSYDDEGDVFDDDTDDKVVRETTNNTNIISRKKTTLVKANIDTKELEEKIGKYFTAISSVNTDGFKAVSSAIVDQTDKQASFFNDTSEKLANIVNSVRNLESTLVVNTKENISQSATLNDVLVGNASIVDMFNTVSKGVADTMDNPMISGLINGGLADPIGSITKSLIGKGIRNLDQNMLGGALAKSDKLLGQAKLRGVTLLDGLLNPDNMKQYQNHLTEMAGKAGPLGGILGKVMGKVDLTKFADNPIFGFLRSQLDMNVNGGKIDTSARIADPSQRVDFDAETHTTINKVLPGYLSKILATITGKDEIYHDYQTGRWMTKKSLKKEYESRRKNAALADNDANRNIIEDVFTHKIKSTTENGATQDKFNDFMYYLAEHNIADPSSYVNFVESHKGEILKRFNESIVTQVGTLFEKDPISIASVINQVRANIKEFDKNGKKNGSNVITGNSLVAFSDIEDVMKEVNEEGEESFNITTSSMAKTSEKDKQSKTDTLSVLQSMNKKMDKYDEMISILVNIRDQQSNGKYFLGDPGKIYTHALPTTAEKEREAQDKEASEDNKRTYLQKSVDELKSGMKSLKDKAVDKYNDMRGPKVEVFYPPSWTAKEVAIAEAKRRGNQLANKGKEAATGIKNKVDKIRGVDPNAPKTETFYPSNMTDSEILMDKAKTKGKKVISNVSDKVDGATNATKDFFTTGKGSFIGDTINNTLNKVNDKLSGGESSEDTFVDKVKSGVKSTATKVSKKLSKNSDASVSSPKKDKKSSDSKKKDNSKSSDKKAEDTVKEGKVEKSTAENADKESVENEDDPEEKASKGVLTSLFPGIATALFSTAPSDDKEEKPKHKTISNLMDGSIIDGFRKLTQERAARDKERMDQAFYEKQEEEAQGQGGEGDEEGSLLDDAMDAADEAGDTLDDLDIDGKDKKNKKEKGKGTKGKEGKTAKNGKSVKGGKPKGKWGRFKQAYEHGGIKGAAKNLDRNTLNLGKRFKGVKANTLSKTAGFRKALKYGGMAGAMKHLDRRTLNLGKSGILAKAGNAGKGVLAKAGGLFGGAAAGAGLAKGGGALAKGAGGLLKGAGGLAKGLGKMIPGVGTVIAGASAINNLKNGNVGGAILDGLSMIPGVGGVAASVASMLGADKLLNWAGKGIGKGVKGAWNFAKKVGKGGLGALGAVGGLAKKGAKSVWNFAKGGVKGIGGLAKKAGGAILGGAKGLGGAVLGLGKGAAKGVGGIAKGAGGALAKAGGGLAKGLGKGLGKMIPGVGTVIAGASAINNLKNGNVGGAILDGLSMIPGVGGVAASVASMLGADKLLNGIGKGIGKGVKGAWNFAKKVGKGGLSALGAVGNGIKNVGKGIWGGIKGVGGAIGKGVGKIWGGAKKAGKALWKNKGTIAKAALLGPLGPAYLMAKSKLGKKAFGAAGKAIKSLWGKGKKVAKKAGKAGLKAAKFLLNMTPMGMIANLGTKFKKKLADKGFKANALASAENIAKIALMGTPFGWMFLPSAGSLFNKLNKWVKDIKKGFKDLKNNIKNKSSSSSSSSGGSSSGSGGNAGVPGDKKEFLKLGIGNDFGVDESKMIEGAKKSARVKAWLGSSDENIKKVAKIVRNNGMSPELFFAYDLQEQGTYFGWLNHTNYSGDPYTDADNVSKWAVSQANTEGHVQLAWYDAGNPHYTTPEDKQKEGQEFADKLPKGSIGRMYLAGTAAAVWAAFDTNGLKREYNKVQDYGDPLQGCMDAIKSWGGSTGGGSKSDDKKNKNSDSGSAKSSSSKKDKDKKSSSSSSSSDKKSDNSKGGEGSPKGGTDSKKEKMVQYALDKVGKAKYDQGLRDQAPNYYDCSSLVWFAMKDAGFDVPETIWTTYTMEDDARGPHKYLEMISNSEAKRGDIALFPGHTGILLDEGINMVNAQNPQDGIKENKTEYFGTMSVARIVGTGAGTGGSGGASSSESSSSSSSDEDDGYEKRSDAFISVTKEYAKKIQERIQKTYDRRFEKQQKATQEYLDKVSKGAKDAASTGGSNSPSSNGYVGNPQGPDGNGIFNDGINGTTNGSNTNTDSNKPNTATPSNPLTPGDINTTPTQKDPNSINGTNGKDGQDAKPSETISTEELNLVNKILNKTNSIYKILVKVLNELLDFNSDDDPNLKVLNEILEATNGGVNLSSQEVTILNQIYNKLPEDKQSEINPLLADPILRGW